MKKAKKILKSGALSIVSIGVASGPAVAGVTVSPTNSGDQLVNSILGDSVKLVPGSVKYTGAEKASGSFKDGKSSGLGIDTGIILTTGKAENAVGANRPGSQTAINGLKGDSDLNKLLSTPGASTQDATTLEFKFISKGDGIYFNYVFASEEYNEFVNTSFNDVFGFFVDGKNIALIPESETPVAINTVNGGNPLGTEASNADKYIDNSLNNQGLGKYHIQYDGFTKVFQAQANNLSPGEHTIKLAIADAGDANYDSAVLIEGGSFSGNSGETITPGEVPTPTFTPCTCYLALAACNCLPTTPTPDGSPSPTPPASIPEPSAVAGLVFFCSAAAGKCLKFKNHQKPANTTEE